MKLIQGIQTSFLFEYTKSEIKLRFHLFDFNTQQNRFTHTHTHTHTETKQKQLDVNIKIIYAKNPNKFMAIIHFLDESFGRQITLITPSTICCMKINRSN